MKIDAFLELQDFDKRLKGESQDVEHAKAIEISQFDFGGQGGDLDELLKKNPALGLRKELFAKFGFSIDKEVDRASPLLFEAYCHTFSKNIVRQKNLFPFATVTFRKAGGPDGVPLEYLRIEFENVILTSYTLQSEGEGTATESLDFCFQACRMEYVPQEKTGDAKPVMALKGWDYADNAKW